MKLNQITESRSSNLFASINDPIELAKKTAEYLKKNCSQAINKNKNGYSIHRGVDNTGSVLLVEPSKFSRRSANTSNYFTIIVDEFLDSWKKYPKRSESIICSNISDRTEAYGFSFLVFPFDNARIGVCPDRDIWFSFSKPLKTIGHLTIAGLNDSLENLQRTITGKFDDTYAGVKDLFLTLDNLSDDQVIKLIDNIPYVSDNKLLDYIRENGSVIDFFDDFLNPEKNGFKLQNMSSYSAGNSKEHEVWTDSKCVMVSQDFWDDFVSGEIG